MRVQKNKRIVLVAGIIVLMAVARANDYGVVIQSLKHYFTKYASGITVRDTQDSCETVKDNNISRDCSDT